MSALDFNENSAYAACIGAFAVLKNGKGPDIIVSSLNDTEKVHVTYDGLCCKNNEFCAYASFNETGIEIYFDEICCNWVSEHGDFINSVVKMMACIFKNSPGVSLYLKKTSDCGTFLNYTESI